MVMVAGAALSALLALLTSRGFRRRGPASVLPPLWLLNALGFVAEFAASEGAPRSVALLLYLHVSGMTGLLASGFWSVVNERFDPHGLRRSISRIGLGGTLGGFLGGLTAERLAHWAGARYSLLELALLCVLGAGALRTLGAAAAPASEPGGPTSPAPLTSRYLREIALFVALAALTSSVIDFAFKAGAMSRYGSPEALMQFFALFYTGMSLAGFFLQGIVTPRLLDKAGLGVGLAALPMTLSLAGLLALAAPGLFAQGLLRATDGALGSSVYRSAYEPLYTPVAADRKRAAKAMIDVLVNRAGDALGSLLSWGLVALGPALASVGANIVVATGALGTLALSQRLRRGYIQELAASLRSGAVVLDESGVQDQTTRLTLSQTLSDLNRERLLREINALRAAGSPGTTPPTALEPAATPAIATSSAVTPAAATPAEGTPGANALRAPPSADLERARRLALAVADLLSSDPERLRRGLSISEPALSAFIIPLLGRADVGALAMNALGKLGASVVGQLADALLATDRHSSTVRRRLVRVIATAESAWAAAALGAALGDPDFDVRRQAVRGLEEIASHGVTLPLDRVAALGTVARELGTDAGLGDAERIEHALRLLGLVFDGEAFRLARSALAGQDPKLRGTALEYLDNVLPASIKAPLFALVPVERSQKSERINQELIDELRRSGALRTES